MRTVVKCFYSCAVSDAYGLMTMWQIPSCEHVQYHVLSIVCGVNHTLSSGLCVQAFCRHWCAVFCPVHLLLVSREKAMFLSFLVCHFSMVEPRWFFYPWHAYGAGFPSAGLVTPKN